MKGDFSRDSFDAFKRFTRVLQQQGRVQLDADWNEQVAIFWHYLRALTRGLTGPFSGAEDKCGFGLFASGDFDDPNSALGKELSAEEKNRLKAMLKNQDDFLIGPGEYFVDGFLCENDDYFAYSKQPDLQPPTLQSNVKSDVLIFLDVWERHITFVEDDSIREVALGGADTATRAKLVMQVRHFELPGAIKNSEDVHKNWNDLVNGWRHKNRGHLKAKAKETLNTESDSCVTSPDSGYRGAENHLYRVEIHRGGVAGATAGENGPTLKWSRENGAVIFPIVSAVESETVSLANLDLDPRSRLEVGDWIEIVDDDYVLDNRAEPLLRVEKILAGSSQVMLSGLPTSKVGKDLKKHPLLRRWDQRAGGLELQDDGSAAVKEGNCGKDWLVLEDGIQIQFNLAHPENHYCTGDYWLIPARTAIGDVVWPQLEGEPKAMPPRGIEHHYAPLGIISFESGALEVKADCRPKFKARTSDC
jgi:hypothetical protein